jgi:hypothetical protein
MSRADRQLAAPHVRTRRVVENSRVAGIGRGLNAHRMVAETAVKLAYELYESWMSEHNEVRKAFLAIPTEKARQLAFVRQAAPQLLEEARLVLTDCLRQSDDVVSVRLKDAIADALIKDTDLRANRLKAAEHMPVGLLH